ncbi:MAG TPA: nitrogen regulation protein NR(II) [Moraxellaceae bacterium]|nr:nitrogen regulation protein NR(II) [Moraxellaceae bacterium]
MTEPPLHRRLLDNLTTAVVVVDAGLRVRYLNPAAEALLACSRARAVGQPFRDIFLELDGDSTPDLKESLATLHPFTKREVRLRAGSQEITVDYTAGLLMGPGEPASLLVEIQQVDRMLRIARDEALLASHQATRALIRGVAHEIKNPLGGIRGAAQLLAKLPEGADVGDYTSIIIEEADRLRALADRMLGPRKLPELQHVNIHECLERVRSLILVEAGGRVQLRRDYDPSLPEINADPDQLIQALLNIAGNALQALLENPAQEDACITLRTRHMSQFTIGATRHRLVIRVDILDNGPGIPPALLETIFYPMVSGRANGTGLGLSIAQDIVHQYHGLIECESRPGQTLFSILLPVEPEHGSK